MKKVWFILRWLGLSLALLFLWIICSLLAETLVGYSLSATDTSAATALGLFFVVCLLNTLVIVLLLQQVSASAWKLWYTLVALLLGIQYILPQSETLWFIDAIPMPLQAVSVVLVSGVLLAFTFSALAVRLKPKEKSSDYVPIVKDYRVFWMHWAMLCVLVYPLLYFSAGYFIAWQSEEVRLFYSGSNQMAPFFSMLADSITSGLYLFQIIRASVWVALAWMALRVLRGSTLQQALVVGLLFAVLMNAQLLLPNPYMPASVRWVHLIETASSNFVWGVSIVYLLRPVMSSGEAVSVKTKYYKELA